MRYIQAIGILKSFIEPTHQRDYLPTTRASRRRFIKGTILIVRHVNFVDNEIHSIECTYAGEEHSIPANENFRYLLPEEVAMYQAEVTVVEQFLLVPTEQALKFGKADSFSTPTLNADVGRGYYIDGFSYDSHEDRHVPYTLINEVPYEIQDDKIMLTSRFNHLIDRTRFPLKALI